MFREQNNLQNNTYSKTPSKLYIYLYVYLIVIYILKAKNRQAQLQCFRINTLCGSTKRKSLKKNNGMKSTKFWIVVLSGEMEGPRKNLEDIGNFLFLKMDGLLVYVWSLYCWILNCKYTYIRSCFILYMLYFMTYFICSFISKKEKKT